MAIPYTLKTLRRIDAIDLAVCRQVNQIAIPASIKIFFRLISRLGDGAIWYAMLMMLPLVYGHTGALATLHMGLTALVGVALYKYLKERLVRDRPFDKLNDIVCGAPILDQYSFPSGHTLHAASFITMLAVYYPTIFWMALPFGILVAVSRIILGLHYPTDVIAGAAIGFTLARLSLFLFAI